MRQGVNTGGSRQRRRHADHEHRVVQSQMRKAVRVHHEHLRLRLFVRDDVGTRALGAGAGRRVDGDDRRTALFRLVVAVVILNLSTVGGQDAHGLCHIDRRAAADGDDRIALVLLIEMQRVINDPGRGVRLHAVIDHILDVRIIENSRDLSGGADLDEALIRHNEDALRTQALQKMRDLGDAVAPDERSARGIQFNNAFISHSCYLHLFAGRIAQNRSSILRPSLRHLSSHKIGDLSIHRPGFFVFRRNSQNRLEIFSHTKARLQKPAQIFRFPFHPCGF